jgi:hypothetical protein
MTIVDGPIGFYVINLDDNRAYPFETLDSAYNGYQKLTEDYDLWSKTFFHVPNKTQGELT